MGAVAMEAWYGMYRPGDGRPGFQHAGCEYPTFDTQEEQRAADPLVCEVFEAFFPPPPPRSPALPPRGQTPHPGITRPPDMLRRKPWEAVRQKWIEKYATLPEDALARMQCEPGLRTGNGVR